MVAIRKKSGKPTSAANVNPYRDRIIDLRRVPASELVPAPLNPRVHPQAQNDALRASLSERGIADTLLTYLRADGRLGLIDGHERTELLGDTLVPVVVTDLTEDEALAFLAEHDAITLLALYDASRSEQLAQALEARHSASADLLRTVAEANPAASLLEAMMLRADERAGYLLGGAGGRGGEGDPNALHDEDDDTSDDWAFDDDGRLSDSEADDDADGQESQSEPPLFDRERILDAALAHYRASGFPYRKLPVFVSMQRLNKLASTTPRERLLRTSVGGDVADTYHPHRFAAHVVSGTSGGRHNSPLESFGEDKLLRHALALRFDDAGVLHDGYPTTLNVVNHTQAVSNFRPGFAAYLYREYVTQPGAIVLDTSTGYGGRLVGYFASGVWRGRDGEPCGRYVGIDPNTLTHAGNTRMASDLGFSDCVTLINEPAEDVDVDARREGLRRGLRGVCDFAFTSPPYFTKERYADEETQSWKRYPTPDAWRVGFLAPMLRLTYDALKAGAYALLNVDDVLVAGEEIPLVAWTLEAARVVGFEHVETRGFDLSTSFGLGHDAGADEREPVLVLRKPAEGSQDAPETRESDPKQITTTTAVSVTVPQPMTLAGWMARLYRQTCDERTLSNRFLGVWPEELRDYLERMCLLHTTQAARFAVADGLIIDQSQSKPREPDTCALMFSGGKDSIAAGLVAQREYGYKRIHALFVRKVNHRFPEEGPNAERIARLLGWEFTAITPTRLPKAFADGVVKNQYIAAVALESLPYIPGAVAFGNHAYDDVNSCPWYSDLACAYEAFDAAPCAAYGGSATLKRLPALVDEVHAYGVWRELSPEIQNLTTSCILPEYNKIAHRRRSLAKGLPLTDYECGVCEKCRGKALIFARHFSDDPIARAYPAWYLDECRRRMAQVASEQASWTHTHPRLITWDIEQARREGRAPQSSMEHYLRDVLGGLGRYESKVKPRDFPPAFEPIVTRVDRQTGYALPGEPSLVISAQPQTSSSPQAQPTTSDPEIIDGELSLGDDDD